MEEAQGFKALLDLEVPTYQIAAKPELVQSSTEYGKPRSKGPKCRLFRHVNS
jgi:hypothetical protein